jgi:hypothetical protein
MSPVAAGVGLTVVGANNVIHLQRHWNPAGFYPVQQTLLAYLAPIVVLTTVRYDPAHAYPRTFREVATLGQ